MSRLQKLLGVGKGYLERLPPVDVHKLLRIVLMNLPYIVIFYVGNKLAWLYQYCVGDSMIERLMVLILNFQMAFSRILPSMHKNELLVGITGAVAVKLMVYMKGKNAKKFRQGVEYGSARWGTAKDIAPFIDPVFENNILLTMTERLTMNGRPKNPKYARNKNILVIGERDRDWRIWLRKDTFLCKTQLDADGKIHQLCGHGPERECETFQSEKDWHISTESLFIVMKLVRVGELNA